MATHVRQLTATDMIFISAKQRGKPITSEDLKGSDIMYDLRKEEKVLSPDTTEAKNCTCFCLSKYGVCNCSNDKLLGG